MVKHFIMQTTPYNSLGTPVFSDKDLGTIPIASPPIGCQIQMG